MVRHFHRASIRPAFLRSRRNVQRIVVLTMLFLVMGTLVLVVQPGIAGLDKFTTASASALERARNDKVYDLNSDQAKIQLVSLNAQNAYTFNRDLPSYSSETLLSRDDLRALLKTSNDELALANTVTTLNQAPSSVVTMLVDALVDQDLNVRLGAAKILGLRRATQAQDRLLFATFDSASEMRAMAAWALGNLNAVLALPRLEWLQLTETDSAVRDAATEAIQKIYTRVANELGITSENLRELAIASSNGRTYAITPTRLYGPGDPGWRLISRLPDTGTRLATNEFGRVLYLGTESGGMYKSEDSGVTWRAINSGLPLTDSIAVTAITLNPQNQQELFITLGKKDHGVIVPLEPIGLYHSKDGGATWSPMVQWQIDYPTTRLAFDPAPPSQLYGMTATGVWQYVPR